MRQLGSVLICISVIAFLGAFAMETAVASELGSRVYQLGPARKQENAILMAVAFYFGGSMLVVAGMRWTRSRPAASVATTKDCGFCARTLRIDAQLCRYCRKLMGMDSRPIMNG
jgi:hypothetical protein